MLKIRMQGTKKDLHWFRRLLERQEDVDVKSVSEPFANKGTGPEFCKKQQNSGLSRQSPNIHTSMSIWLVALRKQIFPYVCGSGENREVYSGGKYICAE